MANEGFGDLRLNGLLFWCRAVFRLPSYSLLSCRTAPREQFKIIPGLHILRIEFQHFLQSFFPT
jgi:hypothetical protein